MRGRAAAALLCGPLLAACGTAKRVDFAGHTRPAVPLEVSVVMGRYGPTFDPDATRSSIRPGLVLFDITNQSSYRVRFSVRRHGRTLARTPPIAPGQAAQLQATLGGAGITFDANGTRANGTFASSQDLNVAGRARSGNNDLTQP